MAAGDGLTEFVTPYSTSEFEEMVRAFVAHSNALRGQAEVIAVDLRRLLPQAKNVGGRLPLNLDLKYSAIQVSRRFLEVAAAENAAASAASRALSIFHGNFTAPGSHGPNSFDAGR